MGSNLLPSHFGKVVAAWGYLSSGSTRELHFKPSDGPLVRPWHRRVTLRGSSSSVARWGSFPSVFLHSRLSVLRGGKNYTVYTFCHPAISSDDDGGSVHPEESESPQGWLFKVLRILPPASPWELQAFQSENIRRPRNPWAGRGCLHLRSRGACPSHLERTSGPFRNSGGISVERARHEQRGKCHEQSAAPRLWG